MSGSLHIPVLLDEVLTHLAPRDGAVIVDATFGAGGYSRAILDAAPCTVIAIDRDPDAIARGAPLRARYGERLRLLSGRFGALDHLLDTAGIAQIDGVVFDLGVSSPQIDQAERGFSFRHDGPLDMRMEADGPSAADLMNDADEQTLIDIFGRLGEERHAKRVARAVIAARPLTRTGELAQVIRRVVPAAKDGIDPATRSFQGLRLAVNDELGELSRGLQAAEQRLAADGRLVVVSFHSLEDRIVKQFLAARSGRMPAPSRHAPPRPERPASFTVLTRRPVTPSAAEIAANPRARSARLRAACRTTAPAWPAEVAA